MMTKVTLHNYYARRKTKLNDNHKVYDEYVAKNVFLPLLRISMTFSIE